MQRHILKENKKVERENDEKQMSAVGRTISILEALSKEESINLENLAKITGLPKATLLRFLSSLSSLGYVYRDNADMYHLTLKMFSVGSRSLNHVDLINTARPFTKKLAKDLGETVHMGILEEDEAVYLLKEESSYTIRMHSRVGKSIPLYCTAIGKIFLSEMTEQELGRYISSHNMKPFTPKSIRGEKALKEELNRVRERGWSIDDEEHEENIMCLGAPIKDYTGKTIAAISVSWPLFRFDKSNFENIVSRIMETTDAISRILGYTAE